MQAPQIKAHCSQQDPLAFLLAEAMGDVPGNAFAAIDAITFTNELAAPVLQRGEVHAQQQRQLARASAFSDALIKDLQRLLAIVWGCQSGIAPIRWTGIRASAIRVYGC